MKKLVSMLLLLCTAVAFTACSSDDNPVIPVSNVVMPATAKIGSEVTIQGSGFSVSGLSLQVLDAAGTASVWNAAFSASGVTFKVPYSTAEGVAHVTLVQSSGLTWPLGDITFTPADNPIASLALPETVVPKKTATIAGIGFEQDDVIGFTPVEGAERTNAESAAPTAEGLSFMVPDLTEGAYTVTLSRGTQTWTLGTVAVACEKLVESMKINSMFVMQLFAMAGQMVTDGATFNFAYNDDGTLSAISSVPELLKWEFAYDGNEVTTTSPFTDKMLKFEMQDGKVVKSTAAAGEDEHDEFNYWAYDADNRLTAITNQDETGKWYRGNDLKSVVWADGSVAKYDLGGEKTFTFGGNLAAVPNTIDPVYLVDIFNYLYTCEDAALGMLLSHKAKTSARVPTKMTVQDYSDDFMTLVDKEVELNTTFVGNVLTMDASAVNTYTGFYGSQVVVTYKNK